MTDQIPGRGDENGGAAQGGPGRPASVQFRAEGDEVAGASMMDPANQSLAEALRITFRILQTAMVVLAVLYVGSGLQSIRANERGVRLIFGKVAASDLRPGFHWAAPYPAGELIKVDVGNQDLDINRAFWPYVEPGKEKDPVENLRARASLSPEQDGSLLTADGAIAHTQWKVQYSRSDAKVYAQTVYPPHETGLVRAAVQRGIVQAVAGVEIDSLLKQSASEEGSVATRAKEIARGTLRGIGVLGAGIEIEQLSLEQKIPPAYLRDSFNSVLEAASNASKARENAQKEGNTLLSDAAGGAVDVLVALIDDYERQIDADHAEAAATTLAKIDRVFDGKPVEVAGVEVNPAVGGQVFAMLSRARQYRDGAVDRARSDLAVFRAMHEQFKANPSVMVTGAWTTAVSQFFADERVEVFFNPAGTDTLELVINRDPEFMKRRERAIREKENIEARERRQKEMEDARYRTDEGLRQIPG